MQKITSKLVGALLLIAALVPLPARSANPLIYGDSVFVAGQGLTRFDQGEAQPVWRRLPRQQVRAPVLFDGLLLVAAGTQLLAIEPGSGATRWSQEIGSTLFQPTVHDGVVYAAARDGGLHAHRVDDGTLLWRRQLGDGWIYPPAVSGDLLITGGQEARVWAVDRHDGQQRWQVTLDQELVYSPVADGAGRVLVTTFSGEVIALDARQGDRLWRGRFAAPSLTPALYQQRVLLPGMDGELRAVELSTGALQWQQPLGAAPVAPLAVAGDRLLLLTREGDYLLIAAGDGELITRGSLPGEPVGVALAGSARALFAVELRNEYQLLPVSLNVEKN